MEDWVSCDACGEVVKNPWRGGAVNCPNCGRLLVLINPVRRRRVLTNGVLKYGVGVALVCGAAVFGVPWLFNLLVDDRPGRQLIEVQPSSIASGIVEWEPSSTIPDTPAYVSQPEFVSPAVDEPPVPASHGIMQPPQTSSMAPFAVRTPKGSNYYVKLVNPASQETILTAYVQGGQYFKTRAPLGTFELRYAAGKTWYGTDRLFGPETTTHKADTPLHFFRGSDAYSGVEVELIQQAGGNFPTRHIPRSRF